MTKAEAGRKGGLAGDGPAKAARMREGRNKRIAELERDLDEARAVAKRAVSFLARLHMQRSFREQYPWLKDD